MIFPIKKTQTIEVEEARQNLMKLLNEWKQKVIDDNHTAIKEIKALDAQSFQDVRSRLILAIIPYLPHVANHLTNIVDGILNFTEAPYKEYLSEYFSYVLFDLSKNNIKRFQDNFYLNNMNDFLFQEKKSGNIGSYFFHHKKFELKAERINSISFNLETDSQLEAKVKMNSDNSIKQVEKDEIGLQNFLQDLVPQYLKFLKGLHLSHNVNNDYNKHINEIFTFNNQRKAIENINIIMSKTSRRSTNNDKAA